MVATTVESANGVVGPDIAVGQSLASSNTTTINPN